MQQLLAENAMLFSLEGSPALGINIPVGAQSVNAGWILDCFGESALEDIAQQNVSCSGMCTSVHPRVVHCRELLSMSLASRNGAGVTVGAAKAVLQYIEQYMFVYEHNTTDICRSIIGSDQVGCSPMSDDMLQHTRTRARAQGVHNYMLHYLGRRRQLTFKWVVLDNWQSPILSAGFAWPLRMGAEQFMHVLGRHLLANNCQRCKSLPPAGLKTKRREAMTSGACKFYAVPVSRHFVVAHSFLICI